ncbi:MAG TPA: hypothetical protein DDW29_00525 [Gammaproteobacteria bacterium]|nr:hypothetical protein [Gammaproteobacteria bacterium]
MNSMKYRAEIDGLRALAVLPVILFHAGFEWFSGGFIGVDVFFVISGYLITTIIISELAEGKFSIVNFYERRARRILPAMFFVMAVCLPFAWLWFAPSDLKIFGQSLLAVSTFWSNFLFWGSSGYFERAAELNPMLHTWSLAVEEQYYILFPVFLILTWRLGIKWILILLSLVFMVSLSLAHWGAYNHHSAAFYLLPTRGWELLIGVFAAFYLKYNGYLKSKLLNQILSLLGFSMVIYSIIVFDETTPFPSLYALIPTIGTCLLILSAVPNTVINRFLSVRPIVAFGLISYSAYLWHQPVLAFARYRFLGEVSDFLLIILCITAFIMAWFSWRFIEKPFRDKERFSRSDIFRTSIISIAFFCSIGYLLNQSNGGLKSYSAEDQNIFKSFINPSAYVEKRHKEIRLRNFDEDSDRKKVLIIGDSHSEDLVNAVFEAELTDSIDFSSYYIPLRCGVLFVDKKEDREQRKFTCKAWRNFEDEFFDLVSVADEVWVVADWEPLDLTYMRESVLNLKMLNNAVLVFGKKDFGNIYAGIYKNSPKHLWSKGIHRANSSLTNFSAAYINRFVAAEVKSAGAQFIDMQFLLCGGAEVCPNYVDGEVLSYDGSHLTPFGATFLGNKLKSTFNLIENSGG